MPVLWALVGSVAPSDWPGICQKKAKFKGIPPSVRAFDGRAGMHVWNCLWVAAPCRVSPTPLPPMALTVHSTHPGLFGNTLSMPLRVPATHGLVSQGAAPVPRFLCSQPGLHVSQT